MELNFNSAICTSREQSERLLALGLKKETADCHYEGRKNRYEEWEVSVIGGCYYSWDYPAWSLHRLMCLCPAKLVDGRERVIKDMYTPDEYELWVSLDQCSYLDVTARYGGETLGFFYEGGNLYDALIACIECLIKNGNFNKEYLEE